MAKILVVEDNALNIKLFCDLLAAHGHAPEAVTDSREAMARARSFAPELIITDIQLPHISGVELIGQLRADAAFADVPIMAVTAYSASGDEERIRSAGASAYISKPISVARFIQSVEELLGARDSALAPADERRVDEGTAGGAEAGGEDRPPDTSRAAGSGDRAADRPSGEPI